MLAVRLSMAAMVAVLVAGLSHAQTVDEIRTQWQSLRRFQSPPVGQWLAVAADDYSGTTSTSPADPEQAEKLSQLAHKAAELGEAALAIRLATEAVDADPNCESARLALGYERYEDRWLTAYGVRMAKRGQVWNADYGWIEPEDLARYQAGERPMRRRWVSAEVDAEAHREIEEGWQIRTDHFVVTTNHSLEAGTHLAAKLEQLYQVWLQLFADFAIDNSELLDRFEKHRVPGVRSRPFQVVFHRDRDQYNRQLLRRQPLIGKTIGIYFDHQREAHFFHSTEFSIDSTLLHESVHQLFQESDSARRDPGTKHNFWAIEGVACWFETLAPVAAEQGERLFTIGTPTAGRLPGARLRLVEQGYHVSLAELVSLGKNDLQQRSDLAPLYGEATALAAFCLQTPPRHRSFVEYLQQVYAGKDDSTTLAELMGASYPELDAEFQQFVRQLPAE
ncbi:hypothetical protein [Aeoliella mucimassa]|uniref:DUF1570 domain-containing protein n=1 Tax=Aeoliella mucimassa TaxID=2527972 RepID=A0A518AL85_9BACT|nr:hypothetical protein [Aeoliella mucimassa]QDU55493.1 hypothetical protein Pan181_16820 [Aeoliella mucimassa]